MKNLQQLKIEARRKKTQVNPRNRKKYKELVKNTIDNLRPLLEETLLEMIEKKERKKFVWRDNQSYSSTLDERYRAIKEAIKNIKKEMAVLPDYTEYELEISGGDKYSYLASDEHTQLSYYYSSWEVSIKKKA